MRDLPPQISYHVFHVPSHRFRVVAAVVRLWSISDALWRQLKGHIPFQTVQKDAMGETVTEEVVDRSASQKGGASVGPA